LLSTVAFTELNDAELSAISTLMPLVIDAVKKVSAAVL